MDFYKTQFVRYLSADAETRKASREHWTRCHADNILSDRDDLIIFSAKILAAYDLADSILADQH